MATRNLIPTPPLVDAPDTSDILSRGRGIGNKNVRKIVNFEHWPKTSCDESIRNPTSLNRQFCYSGPEHTRVSQQCL